MLTCLVPSGIGQCALAWLSSREWPCAAPARSALGYSGSQHVYVGLAGLEPATSCTQSTRASQAALQPVPPEDIGMSAAPSTKGGHRRPQTPYLPRL